MMRGRQFAIWGIACVAVALVVGWWFITFERKVQTIDLPPRGEARFNPVYALKQALVANGQRVDARERLLPAQHPLHARDTVVLLGDTSTMSKAEADALLAWVAAGGHLVLETGYGDDGDKAHGPLFRGLSFEVPTEFNDGGCARLWQGIPAEDAPKARSRNSMFCHADRMRVPPGRAIAEWRDVHVEDGKQTDNGAVFARLAHGAGTVDVLTDLRFLQNPWFEHGRHAHFARQLLAPNWGAGTFHLIYASDMPPLWRLLLEHAWMIFLPLLVALSGWLWMRAQRFGPLLPSPAEERRSLLEHVQASGEHLHRYGRAHLLHAALRAEVLARLRRRDPVAAALEGATQAAAIAARTGMSPSDIEQALRSPRPLDAKDFRQRISRLIALRRHL